MAERTPAIIARSDWLRAVREFARKCPEACQDDTRDLVRDLNELLLVAPEAALLAGVQPMAPTRVAVLLEHGAHDSAVLAMLDRGSGYLLSRNGDGHSLASVVLRGTAREKSAAGATPALALMGALALSLTSAAASARLAAARRPATAAVLH